MCAHIILTDQSVDLINPAAPKNLSIAIEDGGLPWCQSKLRLFKCKGSRVVLRKSQLRICTLASIPRADLKEKVFQWGVAGNPVNILNRAFRLHDTGTRGHLDDIISAVQSPDIHPFSKCDSELSPLANRKTVQAVMMSDDVTVLVMNLAPLNDRRISALDKLRQLSLFDKTEVLTLAAGYNRQTAFLRVCLDVGFRHFSEREQQVCELFLIQTMQKVGLILGWIECTMKVVKPVIFLADMGIMAGRKVIAAQLKGSIHQESEFDECIALDAWRRRSAGCISLNKGIHNSIREKILCIHHIVSNIEITADAARTFYILQRAAPGAFFPHVGCQSDDFISLINQHGRSRRAICSSAHSNGNATLFLLIFFRAHARKIVASMRRMQEWVRIDYRSPLCGSNGSDPSMMKLLWSGLLQRTMAP